MTIRKTFIGLRLKMIDHQILISILIQLMKTEYKYHL